MHVSTLAHHPHITTQMLKIAEMRGDAMELFHNVTNKTSKCTYSH
jgi:hypothetical protein